MSKIMLNWYQCQYCGDMVHIEDTSHPCNEKLQAPEKPDTWMEDSCFTCDYCEIDSRFNEYHCKKFNLYFATEKAMADHSCSDHTAHTSNVKEGTQQ